MQRSNFEHEIKKHIINDDLFMTIGVSSDESRINLNVDYKQGKFTIKRSFSNSYLGLEDLETTKELFNTPEKVKKYLRLED
jgi:hypothetical protein